ncbi:hypothetical protein HZS_3348, partial [Henneguya salminicola]
VKLEGVLRHGSQSVIQETISNLLIEFYIPFLNLVIICIINVAHRYIKRISKEDSEIIRWICCILTTRASFIASAISIYI